jgi:hypothetical protein
MSNTKDGGQAFPHRWNEPNGMSLRDWFAGQALAGMFRHDGWINTIDDDQIEVAKRSYKIADAMLAARSNSTGGSEDE